MVCCVRPVLYGLPRVVWLGLSFRILLGPGAQRQVRQMTKGEQNRAAPFLGMYLPGGAVSVAVVVVSCWY